MCLLRLYGEYTVLSIFDARLIGKISPGMVRTELARGYNSLLYRIAMAIASFLILRTPEQGARTYVSGVGLGLAGHGRFWQHDVIRE